MQIQPNDRTPHTLIDLLLLSSFISLLCLTCLAVGIDDSVKRYASELLGSGRTVALLLYGMGGVGKSTLAQKLHDTLRNSGQFTGGTFEVTVQRQFYVGVSSHGTAQLAQQRLLASVLRHEATCTRSAAAAELDLVSGLSMDQGRAQLEAAFKKTTAPVLLKVDNIPEDNPGIQGMLPDNLLNLLPDRWVRLGNVSSAAVGLNRPRGGGSGQPRC